MKTKFTKWMALIAIAATVVAFAPGACAQDVPPIIKTLTTGIPATFAGSATSNYTAVVDLTLKRNNGLAFIPTLGCTNGSTAATTVTFSFNFSADGTHYTTTDPITYAVTMNGTNDVVGYKLIAPTVIDHMRYIRLTKIVNANTNVINISSLKFAYFNVFR